MVLDGPGQAGLILNRAPEVAYALPGFPLLFSSIPTRPPTWHEPARVAPCRGDHERVDTALSFAPP